MTKLQRVAMALAMVCLLIAGLLILPGCSSESVADREERAREDREQCNPFQGRRVLVDGAPGWAFRYNGTTLGTLHYYPEGMAGPKHRAFSWEVACARMAQAWQ